MVPADGDNIFSGALAQDVDFIALACAHFENTSITKEQMVSFAKSDWYSGPLAKDTTIKLNPNQKRRTLYRLLENSILIEEEKDSFRVVDPIVLARINAAIEAAKEN